MCGMHLLQTKYFVSLRNSLTFLENHPVFNLTSCISKIHRLDTHFWAEPKVSVKGRVFVTYF